MSYAIAQKIKELRLHRKINQEDMAEALQTTRQRYARIENGQVSISYIMIKDIANILGVSVQEITSAADEKKDLTVLFREKNDTSEAVKAVEKIQEILKYFHAHERLYYQMKDKE